MDERNRVNKISAKLITEVEDLKGSVKAAEDRAKAKAEKAIGLKVQLSTSRRRVDQLRELEVATRVKVELLKDKAVD